MYLCEVAIVSQLCISFPYVLHGLCEDYLTCDIAVNAVMPPSRASTRGRYSRIEGVTSGTARSRATVRLTSSTSMPNIATKAMARAQLLLKFPPAAEQMDELCATIQSLL